VCRRGRIVGAMRSRQLSKIEMPACCAKYPRDGDGVLVQNLFIQDFIPRLDRRGAQQGFSIFRVF
jgi:hypothetical protein